MKSATKRRFRPAEFTRLRIELLEARLPPGSMLSGVLGGALFGDALNIAGENQTWGALSAASPDRVLVQRASRFEDVPTSLLLASASQAMALASGHDEQVSSLAQAATSTGLSPADELLDQLLLNQMSGRHAHLDSAAAQPARPSADFAADGMPGSAPTVSQGTPNTIFPLNSQPAQPTPSQLTAVVKGSNSHGKPGGAGPNVLQHHNNDTRDGLYVDPLITQKAAAAAHRDPVFRATLPGPTYSQPLFVSNGPNSQPAFIVATERNVVLAINGTDGSQLWSSTLGTPVSRSQLPCGDIDPLGVTGTPVIDLASRTIYVAAMTTPDGGTTKQHQIFALSLDDGSLQAGWPVDVNSTVPGFNSAVQNQRGALLLNNGVLYVPYGGHFGDCGTYHGWVVAVAMDDPTNVTAFETDARGAGIWAPGGLSTDGMSIFAATGNAFGSTSWMGGEAILRLGPGGTFSGDPADYFTPSNWRQLDNSDTDVGGSGALLIDVPGADPSQLVVSLGKNGVAYLLDRNYLGGIGTGDGINGEGLQSRRVASGTIINAAASFTTDSGTYVVFTTSGNGVGCPGTPGNLVGLRIGAASPPTIDVAWCANNFGRGSPIVTTTDGASEPVVWTAGSESSNRLHAYNGETGEVIFAGGGANEQMTQVRRFQTPIAVNGSIYVAADNELYAFSTQ